jgi:aspartyl-tRNA(Asn)/glutamyl-tRNA(Gln) amidotransferase subunit B
LRELGFRCDCITRCQSTSSYDELGHPAPFHEPFRKQLRFEAREKKSAAKLASFNVQKEKAGIRQDPQNGRAKEPVRRVAKESGWELTVGIEIHAELDTERKLFSTAGTSVNDTPNSNVALCDLAYPGAQPLFQTATLLPALRAALALNCRIERKSSFDRKHYFYQDQPAGYQITQYYGSSCLRTCQDVGANHGV